MARQVRLKGGHYAGLVRLKADTTDHQAGPPLSTHVSGACTDDDALPSHLHLDRVPSSIACAGHEVGELILPVQLVGKPHRRRIEVLEAVDDFGSSTGIVGKPPQAPGVETLAAVHAE